MTKRTVGYLAVGVMSNECALQSLLNDSVGGRFIPKPVPRLQIDSKIFAMHPFDFKLNVTTGRKRQLEPAFNQCFWADGVEPVRIHVWDIPRILVADELNKPVELLMRIGAGEMVDTDATGHPPVHRGASNEGG